MCEYSKAGAGQLCNLHHEADEAESRERLSAFFAGAPVAATGILDLHAASQVARDDALLSQLDALLGDVTTAEAAPPAAQAAADDDEPTFEIIENEPVLTHYDRARAAVREAEAERRSSVPGTEAHCTATARLAEAKGRLKTEIERDGDDGWRFRRRIDEWRKTDDGRDERNASRRKVRPEPNKRLKDMTAEDRAAHERALDNDRKWVARQRKAGWTEEQITAGLEKRRMKRLTEGKWTV